MADLPCDRCRRRKGRQSGQPDLDDPRPRDHITTVPEVFMMIVREI